MQPTILHLLADDRQSERNRTAPPAGQSGRPRRARQIRGRARAAVGGLLITLGTRLSGATPATGELQQHPTA